MQYINVLTFQIAKQASSDSFTSFGTYFEKTITHRFCMWWTQMGSVLFNQFQQLNHASLQLRWHIKNLVFNPSVKINSPSHRNTLSLGVITDDNLGRLLDRKSTRLNSSHLAISYF